MSSLLNQIFSLLTTPPGNLIYHLVLVFSIAGTLWLTFNHWRSSEFPQARRTLFGLGLLLLAQIFLFMLGGLGWQNLIDPNLLLPPADRAVSLFGLIWIIWLWAFPEPGRLADILAIALSLLIAVGFSLSVFILVFQPALLPYNSTLQNTVWQILSIGFTLFGGLLIYLRRPNGWVNGLALLGLAFLGHLTFLITKDVDGNYPGAVRLAYIAAYPILLTLTGRFPAPAASPIIKQEGKVTAATPQLSAVKTGNMDGALASPLAAVEARRRSIDPESLQSLLDLASESEADTLNQAITRAVALVTSADLCFLLYPAPEENQLRIASGYDLVHQVNLEGANVDTDLLPLVTNAIQRGRSLRLPASDTSIDLKNLENYLGLTNQSSNLLCAPILAADKKSLGGVLLLSPFSKRIWDSKDQTFLVDIAARLAPIVQREHRLASLEQNLQEAKQSMEEAQRQVKELEGQNVELKLRVEALGQTTEAEARQAEELTAAYDQQRELQHTIEKLQEENLTLQAAAKDEAAKTPARITQLEQELHQSLEQISFLQNELASANTKILEIEKEQPQVVVSIAQELRQPMSSIVGYTDLLLGESIGILGAMQRKFVERIKASTERIGSLINDLIHLTTLEMGLSELRPEPIDLNNIIDNAMAYTSTLLREKNITMHLNLPKTMAPIYADREALQQSLIHLLQNAGAATPPEGVITLRVQTQSEDGGDYVLIQVTDSGGGIAAEDLPRVFSRLYRADNVLIQGVGDTGVGLSIAKTLTEAQNGRIWVNTEPGIGSTFSVLLPIAKSNEAVKQVAGI
jgi:signal transduction histidine kinase